MNKRSQRNWNMEVSKLKPLKKKFEKVIGKKANKLISKSNRERVLEQNIGERKKLIKEWRGRSILSFCEFMKEKVEDRINFL